MAGGARIEIEQAIECSRSFGYAAEPWKSSNVLSELETGVGNHAAAVEARTRGMQAYLAYRRDGGEPQVDSAFIAAHVKENPDTARTAIDDLKVSSEVAAEMILALEAPDNK